jgi:transcriptional regulator with XRE-family HTH domain
MAEAAAQEKIGTNVRYWRARRALTQGQLAEAAGLTLSTVNRIERGITKPHPTTIHKLAVALGVGVEEILRGLF